MNVQAVPTTMQAPTIIISNILIDLSIHVGSMERSILEMAEKEFLIKKKMMKTQAKMISVNANIVFIFNEGTSSNRVCQIYLSVSVGLCDSPNFLMAAAASCSSIDRFINTIIELYTFLAQV
jgi:hypothetical protein